MRGRATGRVKYEFHGEPDGAGLGVAESYEKQEGTRRPARSRRRRQAFTVGSGRTSRDAPITIVLTSAGFYSGATEFRQKYDPMKHKDLVEQIPHHLGDRFPPAKQ